ncbi:MAG: transglutaminase domain-containing protein [Eubacteriales bacterium]|nr:transglutaminase domain-containing protein [Eubacteriales bacterium]
MKKMLLSILTIVLIISTFSISALAQGQDNTVKLQAELISEGKLISSDTYLPSEIVLQSETDIYSTIYDGLVNLEESIDIESFNYNVSVAADTRALIQAFSDVANGNPDLFYVIPSFGVTYSNYTGIIKTIQPEYTANARDSKEIFEIAAAEMLNKAVHEGMTDEEIALSLHDYIASECEYNYGTNVDNDFTAYGIIVDKIGVCQSYTLAYNYLLSLVGIKTKFCASPYIYDTNNNIIGGMGHAWSLVQLDGKWYHVDITWDDPSYGAGSPLNDMKLSQHKHFLLSDANMLTKNHKDWTTDVVCTDTKYENGYPFTDVVGKKVPITPTTSYGSYYSWFPYKYSDGDGLFYTKIYVPEHDVYCKTNFSGTEFEYIDKSEYDMAVMNNDDVFSYKPFNIVDKVAHIADKNNANNLYITFENNCNIPQTGTVIVAFYDEDYVLLYCGAKELAISANGTKTLNIESDLPDGVEYGKILMWDMNSNDLMRSPIEF